MRTDPNERTQSNLDHPLALRAGGGLGSTEARHGAALPDTLPRAPRARLAGTGEEGEFPTRVGLRLPADVAVEWRAAARVRGVSLSEFVRSGVAIAGAVAGPQTGRAAPGRRQPDLARRKYTNVDPELLNALARWGNSLNMIAHRLNSQNVAGTPLDVVSAAKSLKVIESAAQQILAEHLG